MKKATAVAPKAPKAPKAEGERHYRPSKGKEPMRKFGQRRGFPTPTEEDIEKILEANPVHLKNTKEIVVKYARRSPGNAGARSFKHEQVPILKHWSPSVNVRFEMVDKGVPELTIVKMDNSSEVFPVKDLRSTVILEVVKKHDVGEKVDISKLAEKVST